MSTAGGEETAVQRLAKRKRMSLCSFEVERMSLCSFEVVHPIPFRWALSSWPLGRSFYDTAKFGIVQYVSYFITGSEFLASILMSSYEV